MGLVCRVRFCKPLVLSVSPFDGAQGDSEALEGSKDERQIGSWFDKLTTSVSA